MENGPAFTCRRLLAFNFRWWCSNIVYLVGDLTQYLYIDDIASDAQDDANDVHARHDTRDDDAKDDSRDEDDAIDDNSIDDARYDARYDDARDDSWDICDDDIPHMMMMLM